MSEEKCQHEVWSEYDFRSCGKPARVERNGRWYCGIHDPEKIKAREEKAREKRRARSAPIIAAREEADRLAKQLGVGAIDWDRPGNVTLTTDEARALIGRLSTEEP